ncbi:MAG TPA: vitamin K epoxide reductase family protein [Candidatus Dormibacteraeota bacterium]|nr:vitamin K epoxide reductase family protein [Candidatus Dormibacteraeota bacterium]
MSGRPPALILVLAAAVAGAAISIYLTISHYQQLPLACATSSLLDCNAVTTSGYSLLPGTGIPVSLLGVVWFAVSGSLGVLALRRPHRLAWGSLLAAWGVVGAAFVLYLVYAELVVIHRICEWCTAVHLLVVATLLAALTRVTRAAAT